MHYCNNKQTTGKSQQLEVSEPVTEPVSGCKNTNVKKIHMKNVSYIYIYIYMYDHVTLKTEVMMLKIQLGRHMK